MMDVKYFNFSKFLNLPRQIKVVLMILIDASLCCLSIWFAYYLRLGNFSTPIQWMFLPIIVATIISFLIFWFLGIYKNMFRSFDRYNIVKLFEAVLIYSIFFFLIVTIFSIQHVPRTIGFYTANFVFIILIHCKIIF